MPYKKLSDIITQTQQSLSQMSGKGVQVYAETRIGNYIQKSFDLVFKEMWLPGFCTWQTVGLDGVNGLPTSDMFVTSFDDIGMIYVNGTERTLKLESRNINVNRYVGTFPLVASARLLTSINDVKRPFSVWPKAATGQVDVWGRVYPRNAVGIPTAFAADDYILLDDLILEFGACWQYAEDDGTNPGQIQKFKDLYVKRMQQIQNSSLTLASALDSRMQPMMNEWIG